MCILKYISSNSVLVFPSNLDFYIKICTISSIKVTWCSSELNYIDYKFTQDCSDL